MNNKVYDVLKWIAQILLPALGTFYFAIATIWNLPAPDAVGTTFLQEEHGVPDAG